MLVFRPVKSYPATSADEGPAFLVAHAKRDWKMLQSTTNIYGRLWYWPDIAHFFSTISQSFDNTILIRGVITDESKQWERFKSSLQPWMSFSADNDCENNLFALSFAASRLNDSVGLLLPEWGDYAFSIVEPSTIATTSSDSSCDCLVRPEDRYRAATFELIELPWNGAFEVHGAYTTGKYLPIPFNRMKDFVWLNPVPINVTDELIEGEGPGPYRLFAD